MYIQQRFGLSTARGSGTNAYVQSNVANLLAFHGIKLFTMLKRILLFVPKQK
ncbi:unnamed protein product [Meloidogyne enterolobii]|uniref:Uncharacterized protein n=1 Tax=Meloidogyne enterolobii TaxID=390850 RepID=A0ACB1ARM9_MELEN